MNSFFSKIRRVLSMPPQDFEGESDEKERKSFESLYASGWEDCPCVFVLSTGRVGTQTLTSLLNLAPNVEAVHEPLPRLVKSSLDAFNEGVNLRGKEAWHRLLYAARDDFLYNAYQADKIYIETNNRLTFLASALSTAFPSSRFIHLHRHPYDVIRSGMRRDYYQQHVWDYARIRPRDEDEAGALWESFSQIQKIAWYWAKVNEEAKFFINSLPEERGYNLYAEQLFRGCPETLESLFSFVGSNLPNERLIKGILGKKMNAQQKGSFSTPSDWSDNQISLVNEQVFKVATELGYPLK